MKPVTPNSQFAEDNDDLPVGRVLSRREVLTFLGAAGAALLVGPSLMKISASATPTATSTPISSATPIVTATALPACIVQLDSTEGPYFVDERLMRSDVRSDPESGVVKQGVPLQLIFRVSRLTSKVCAPFPNAMVDIWHCDALGSYSDVQQNGTLGQKFLRGSQLTDTSGMAQFLTIYPGWYQGRTVHIHFKIRTNPDSNAGYEFTSQLFFDDALSDIVFKQSPYSAKRQRTILNADDNIFTSGADSLLLQPTRTEDGGYTATFDIGLQSA